MINVVVINGGRGASVLIPELLKVPGANLSSIVNAYDDGKSTGEIRKFFDMLGPSDIRKVQELMLPESHPDYQDIYSLFQLRIDESVSRSNAIKEIKKYISSKNNKDLFNLKFSDPRINKTLKKYLSLFLENLYLNEKFIGEKFSFSDSSLMNCIYAGSYIDNKRNFDETSISIDKLFKLKGTVIPTNIENKFLVGLRENGQILYSEAEIVELRSNVRLKKLFLLDSSLKKDSLNRMSKKEKISFLESRDSFVEINLRAKNAISNADIIIYSPGTQHSSLYPTYLTKGFTESVAGNKRALKIFITNIGEDYETPKYSASDYILGAHKYLCYETLSYPMKSLFDVNFVNKIRKGLKKSSTTYVLPDTKTLNSLDVETIYDNFESEKNLGKHNGKKLVQKIFKLYDLNK